MVRGRHGDTYPLDGGLDGGGLGVCGGNHGVAVGPAHGPVAAAVLGRRRHLAGRRGGGRRGDGHEPPPRQRRREQPGPRRGRVDGWRRGAAAQQQERHRVSVWRLPHETREAWLLPRRAGATPPGGRGRWEWKWSECDCASARRRSEGEAGSAGGDVPRGWCRCRVCPTPTVGWFYYIQYIHYT